jgi:hypothetical protein
MVATVMSGARRHINVHVGEGSGHRPGPGAPPCGRERLTATDKPRADIANLAAAGWGRRAIANKMQLSERRTSAAAVDDWCRERLESLGQRLDR